MQHINNAIMRKELSADERTRLEAEMREKAWRDEMDRYDTALTEGKKEGSIGLEFLVQQVRLVWR